MATPSVAAAVWPLDRLGFGSAAAGCRILFRGRAGFAVTGTARAVPVLLAAYAGMQGVFFWFVLCFRFN
jgi:hypothetical protein